MPTFKAAYLKQFNQPLVVEEKPLPELESGQVLVRITAAGVCGSDVHMQQGEDPRTPLPIILGHEGVGVVEEVAGSVNYVDSDDPVKPGDAVIWERSRVCGQPDCYYCGHRKQPFLCPKRTVYGIFEDGNFATHLVLKAPVQLLKMPAGDDPAMYVPATCSGATAAHAVEEANVRPGDVVTILGAGPLGIFAALLALDEGARKVFMIQSSRGAQRIGICNEIDGVEMLLRDKTSLDERVERIKDETDGRGADVVMECSGSAAACADGVKYLSRGGNYSLPGVAVPVGDVCYDIYKDIILANAHVTGVWVSDVSHTRRAVELVDKRSDILGRLVTHRFELEQINDALDSVRNRDAIKAVVLPG